MKVNWMDGIVCANRAVGKQRKNRSKKFRGTAKTKGPKKAKS